MLYITLAMVFLDISTKYFPYGITTVQASTLRQYWTFNTIANIFFNTYLNWILRVHNNQVQ